MPRKFLIITQVFSPDPAAVGQYFDEAAQAIAATGADVTILTANRGYENPDERFAAQEDRDGIHIRRLPLSSFGKASIPVRIFAQLSFLVQCILRGLFTPKLTDLLVSTSPPMAAITAVIIGFFRPELKVHYWVMDINPDQAVILGAFGPKHPLVLALDWLNRRILKRADSVIALDRFMAERMIAKLSQQPEDRGPRTGDRSQKTAKATVGAPASQASGLKPQPLVINHPQLRNGITIIPPWPMDDHLETVPHSENQFRKEQGWDEKFVVMYSGNHSLVHPLDTILDAAEALKDDDRFVFAFIGGGKGKQAVEDRIQSSDKARQCGDGAPMVCPKGDESGCPPGERGTDQKPERIISDSQNFRLSALSNLISLPYQDLDMIKYSLSAADLHIVSLGDNMSGIVHPCKIYGALSIGRPVLTLGPRESYLGDIIATEDRGQRSGGRGQEAEVAKSTTSNTRSTRATRVGWSVVHGDTDSCIAALLEAADQTQEERAAIGQHARNMATEKFSREKLVRQFLDVIHSENIG